MIKYVLKQNNPASAAFQKWYAYPVVGETMDLEAILPIAKGGESGAEFQDLRSNFFLRLRYELVFTASRDRK